MQYDIDARLKAIAAEECRILRRGEMLVRIAILIGAFLCGVVAAAAKASSRCSRQRTISASSKSRRVRPGERRVMRASIRGLPSTGRSVREP